MLNSPYPPKSFLKLIVTATAIFACVGMPMRPRRAPPVPNCRL